MFGSPSAHTSSLPHTDCYHVTLVAELMIKTSTDTAKMIIRDVLDDDIEVAIKASYFIVINSPRKFNSS